MSFAIYLLQFVAFLDLLAVGLIVPLVSNHVRELGGNHIIVGLLGSIYAGFQLGSGPLIGSLSDIKGRKPILIVTLLVCSITYTVMGITTSITVILIVRAVLGLFKQTQMLTRALVPDYEKNESKHSEIYGKMAAISGNGITLGPIIGGHIAEDYPEYGFIAVSVVVGICFAANAAFVYFLPNIQNRPTRRKSSNRQNQSFTSTNLVYFVTDSFKQSVIELGKVEWSKYWDIFMLKALVGFAMGVYYSNYPLYLKTQFDLSPKHIGYVISFQGIIGSISSFYMGYINSYYSHDEDYSLRNLHIFSLITTSLIGLIVSYNIYLYMIWLIPLAVGNAIGRLVTLEMILKRCHGHHRGTLIGASNSVRSLSGVVAPMVAGFVAHYLGVSYVTFASLFATLIGLILSYYYKNIKIKVD